MAWHEVLNPWGALKKARVELARAQSVYETERMRTERYSLLAISRAHEISQLQRVLKHSHYRDPQTGRIGKRGEYPKP